MNEPTPDNEPEFDVDWWASRLVDRDIEFADVPVDLRGAVHDRSTSFATQRRTLLRSGSEHVVDASVTNTAVAAALRPSDATVASVRRRLVPVLAVAAVSVGVIAIGVATLRPDDSPDVVTVGISDAVASVDATRSSNEGAMVESESAASAIAPADEVASASVLDETDAAPLVAETPSEVIEIADMIELSELFRSWSDAQPPFLAGTPACEDDQGRRALALNISFAGIDAQAYFSPDAGVLLKAASDCSTLASIVP